MIVDYIPLWEQIVIIVCFVIAILSVCFNIFILICKLTIWKE